MIVRTVTEELKVRMKEILAWGTLEEVRALVSHLHSCHTCAALYSLVIREILEDSPREHALAVKTYLDAKVASALHSGN